MKQPDRREGADGGLLSIALVVFLATGAVALLLTAASAWQNYRSSRDLAVKTASELMDRSLDAVVLRVRQHFDPVERVLRNSPDWDELASPVSSGGHALEGRLIGILEDIPQLSSIYAGYSNGDYFLVGAARHRPRERLEKLGAPPATVFIAESILRSGREQAMVSDRFLDAQGRMLAQSRSPQEDFDPRLRPWYKAAQESDGVARTELYTFVGSGSPGISLAMRNGLGVVAADITLAELDNFLSSVPEAREGFVAILGADGKLVARSRAGEATQDAFDALISQAASGKAAPVANIGGEEWILRLEPFAISAAGGQMLLCALPVAAVTRPIQDALRRSLLVSALLAICSIPVLWLIARRLSAPLARLSLEADRIRDFDLRQVGEAHSPVSEIRRLELAMDRMRSNLSSFALYVPKALVRQLARETSAPKLGGERREITVLFLDLQNFTAMSQDLDPEELMRRMGVYFETVTQALLDNGATIDKFIGDAVMALWNAPNDVDGHPALACKAALEILEKTQAMTGEWSKTAPLPLRTRIGIHTGEAVVGNVGSSDRMNYTALGATVNLAARLESLNRETGTAILVSAETARRAGKAFRFRAAGDLQAKGFSRKVKAFELLGLAAARQAVTNRRPARRGRASA
jgi:adenylate cyclase